MFSEIVFPAIKRSPANSLLRGLSGATL